MSDIDVYVGFSKGNFIARYDFGDFTDEEKKDDLLRIYNVLNSVSDYEQFILADKSEIKAVLLGCDFWEK
jgi:hypothetical protein